MKRWVFMALLMLSARVHADALGLRLMGFASQQESIAKFVETWSADYLTEPLISTGSLSYRAPDKLEKIIEHPEHIDQRIDGDRLIITKGGVSRSVRLSDEPVLAAGIYALRDVLAGSEKKLQARFKLVYKESGKAWSLKLSPRDEKVASHIATITVHGESSRISQVSIDYKNGNSSVTEITHDE